MPTFYDWLIRRKGISKDRYNDLSKTKRKELKQEWCKHMGISL